MIEAAFRDMSYRSGPWLRTPS